MSSNTSFHPRNKELYSLRKREKVIKKEDAEEEAKYYIRLGKDPVGFKVEFVNKVIGKGLFTKLQRSKGEFLVEYEGEVICKKEGERRLKEYDESVGSFIFFFRKNSRSTLCIDGSFSGRNAKFANDAAPGSKEENAEMRFLKVDGKPCLALFALRGIHKGEEIRYNYNVPNLPWRNQLKECSIVLTRLDEKKLKHSDNLYRKKTLSTSEGTEDEVKEKTDTKQIEENDNQYQKKALITPDRTELDAFDNRNTEQVEENERSSQENLQILIASGVVENLRNLIKKIDASTSEEQIATGIVSSVKQILSQISGTSTDNHLRKETLSTSERTEDEVKDNRNTKQIEENDNQYQKKTPDRTEVDALGNRNTEQIEENADNQHQKKAFITPDRTELDAFDNRNTEQVEENGISRNGKHPKRPCPFCGKFFSRLSKHLIARHDDEELVKKAKSLPGALKHQAFDNLKNDGIRKYNMELLKRKTFSASDIIKDRQPREKNMECVMCSGCSKFLVKKYMYKHKKRCTDSSSSTGMVEAISTNYLQELDKFSEGYKKSILQAFHKTEVGNQIQEDEWIKTFGYYLYQNIECSARRIQKRKSLMDKMRRLARLFLVFKKIAEGKNVDTTSSLVMFRRENIPLLLDAINKMTVDDENDDEMHHGMKISMRYLINEVCKFLMAQYLIKKEDDKFNELEKFDKLIKTLWTSFFSSAEEKALLNRNTDLRKPQRLPKEEDILKLKGVTLEIVEEICQKKYDMIETKDYNLLRNAVVSRLTLHNARRGGEPCRITMQEWEAAWEDAWIDKYRAEQISDPISQNLLCKYKIAYVHASKLLKLVPLLIPEDCWEAMKILCDPGVRIHVTVNSNNPFVFANTQNSLSHVLGWQCVQQMCKAAELSNPMSATDVRHFVATSYALQDVPSEQRQIMYKHFGHTEMMNENVYQCPEGLREIINVGGFLSKVDRTIQDDYQIEEMESNADKQDPGKIIDDFLSEIAEGVIEEDMPINTLINECEANREYHEISESVEPQPSSSSMQNNSLTLADKEKMVAIREFLEAFASEHVVTRAVTSHSQIEEDEVEVIPENLLPYKELLNNPILIAECKKYFTDDGWLVVESGIKIVQSISEKAVKKDTMKTSEKGKGKGKRKSLLSSSETCVKRRKMDRKKIQLLDDSEINNEYPGENQVEGECNSEEMKKEPKKDLDLLLQREHKQRHTWSEEEDIAIVTFFKEEINNVSTTGNKGSLHVNKKILKFIEKFPHVLKGLAVCEKKMKIRTKVLNLRRKTRKIYFDNISHVTA